MARQASLRAADSDREAVTERLREAAAEGRLDPEELEERVHTALRARTYGELDDVLADLPARSRALDTRRTAGLPSAETAIALVTRVAVTLVVVTLVLVDAALTVTWWLICVLMRAHGYAAGRFRAHPPGRPAS